MCIIKKQMLKQSILTLGVSMATLRSELNSKVTIENAPDDASFCRTGIFDKEDALAVKGDGVFIYHDRVEVSSQGRKRNTLTPGTTILAKSRLKIIVRP
jgi:hypothetical protein